MPEQLTEREKFEASEVNRLSLKVAQALKGERVPVEILLAALQFIALSTLEVSCPALSLGERVHLLVSGLEAHLDVTS